MINDRKKIHFFFHKNLVGKNDGQQYYVSQFLKNLNKEFIVRFFGPGEDMISQSLYTNSILSSSVRFLNTIVWQFLSSLRIESKEANISILEDIYSFPVPLFMKIFRHTPMIFSASDIGFEYYNSVFYEFKYLSKIYAFLRNIIERIIIKNSSAIIVRSVGMYKPLRYEYEYKGRIFYLPHTNFGMETNVNQSRKRSVCNIDFQNKVVIGFIGNCRYKPNFDSAKYITEKLAPHFEKKYNNVIFLMVGSFTDKIAAMVGSSSVIGMGEVESADDVVSLFNVGLIPTKVKGGTSAKGINYLSHKILVLSTPEGASGLIKCNRLVISPLEKFIDSLENIIIAVQKSINNDLNCDNLTKIHYQSDIWFTHLNRELNKMFPSMKKVDLPYADLSSS